MGLFERFQSAVDDLRSRIAISDDDYETLVAITRMKADDLARLQDLRVCDRVLSSLISAIEKGEGLDEWRRQLSDDIQNAWGKGSAYRLETIFRNVTQSAYNRGRYKQMRSPVVKRMRPYWMYDAVLDLKTSMICRDRDGKVLSADDSFWNSSYPPLHHRCRSAVRTLTRRQADRRGISDPTTIESVPEKGFGMAPTDRPPVHDLTGVSPELAAAYNGAV